MSDPQKPQKEAAAAGKPSRASLHHHETDFLDALKLLIDSGRAKTVADLVQYSEQARQGQAAEMLREYDAEGLPLDLAYDALSVHIRITAFKRNDQLLQACAGGKVGLILPLPPHVLDAFLTLPDVKLLLPDGHHLPPVLRRQQGVLNGNRACRTEAPNLKFVVFEAYRKKSDVLVDAATADIVDSRILAGDAQLIVHARAHRGTDDVPLPSGSLKVHIL
jgi:hypothetical protein